MVAVFNRGLNEFGSRLPSTESPSPTRPKAGLWEKGRVEGIKTTFTHFQPTVSCYVPMRYSDFPDETELKNYARAFNTRTRLLGRTQSLNVDTLRGVILESGGVCGWCGVTLIKQDFEIDHIIALADKGAHSAENLVVSCPSCNRQKASQPPLKFVLSLVAKQGHSTPTIQRILDYYGAEAKVQRGLFEE